MWPHLHEMDVLVRLRIIGIRTALKRIFRTILVRFKGSPHEIDQILMMTHILSSDSIRRPLFSTHPTDPEFKSENCLDPHEDYP